MSDNTGKLIPRGVLHSGQRRFIPREWKAICNVHIVTDTERLLCCPVKHAIAGMFFWLIEKPLGV